MYYLIILGLPGAIIGILLSLFVYPSIALKLEPTKYCSIKTLIISTLIISAILFLGYFLIFSTLLADDAWARNNSIFSTIRGAFLWTKLSAIIWFVILLIIFIADIRAYKVPQKGKYK